MNNDQLQTTAEAIDAIIADKSVDYATRAVIQHFTYAHLSKHEMKHLSCSFAAQALTIYNTCPASADRTLALRSLLASKDEAVRALCYRMA